MQSCCSNSNRDQNNSRHYLSNFRVPDVGPTLVVNVPTLQVGRLRPGTTVRGQVSGRVAPALRVSSLGPAPLALPTASCPHRSHSQTSTLPGGRRASRRPVRGRALTDPARQISTPGPRHQLGPCGTSTSRLLVAGGLRGHRWWLPSRKGDGLGRESLLHMTSVHRTGPECSLSELLSTLSSLGSGQKPLSTSGAWSQR